MKSKELIEAEGMRIAVAGLSTKLMEAMRNGRPLSTLNGGDQLTLSWICGMAEAITIEREKNARVLDDAAFVGKPTPDSEWEKAAKTFGINGPGAMQQAKQMAVAAVEALGLVYDTTSSGDIREAIAELRNSYRITWKNSVSVFATDIRKLLTTREVRSLVRKLQAGE